MPLPAFSAGSAVTVEWRESMDMGSQGVEYMLMWATDEGFNDIEGQTGWQSTMSSEVSDLSDGTTYYFRVMARDALGQTSPWGDMTATIMDASGPPAPVFMAMDDFIPGPMVPVGWEPVMDASGQMVEYQVLVYDTDESGASPVATSPWVADPRFEFIGLPPDAMLYFSVVARDPLGWMSDASEMATTTIDTEGPTTTAINAIDAFTQGAVCTIGWDSTNDAGTGGVQYRLEVYEDSELRIPVHILEWTSMTEATVRGLADGMTFYFIVDVRDAFGNVGEPSEAASTTMDASAPMVTVDAPGVFGTIDTEVTGTCSDGGSGVDSVEVSVDDGQTWSSADVDGATWSIAISSLAAGTTEVMVRATDAVGNVVSMPVYATIDRDRPVITILLPSGGEDVSGAVAIVGSIADPHLASYIVEVQKAGDTGWTTVQPSQSTTGVAGTLATWITAGLVGGDYTLRVTATDSLSNSDSASVTITLKGAHVDISPGDITFSDSHPLPGDTVTVLVNVRNDGDSPAEGMSVSLYDGGKLVGTTEGVTVPAHGSTTVPVKVKAKDSHDFTARATSDLYDSGDMTTGQPLQTIEEEAALENAGGILGLIALIVALLALALILMGRMGGGGKVEPEPEPEDEIIVDSFLEQEKVEPEPLPAPVPIEMEIEDPTVQRPGSGGFR
jgi:hypothetical protein